MARRLLYGLIVGLAAFAVGLSLVSLLKARPPMSLCELDANPGPYKGSTIRFRAKVDLKTNFITAASVCRDGSLAGAFVELNPAEVMAIVVPQASMSPNNYLDYTYWMDAEIIGQLNPTIRPVHFGPKYYVLSARVARLFSVRRFNNSQEAMQWFKSSSY